jgi:hypothetical protein
MNIRGRKLMAGRFSESSLAKREMQFKMCGILMTFSMSMYV